jgi:hypothetical protein
MINRNIIVSGIFLLVAVAAQADTSPVELIPSPAGNIAANVEGQTIIDPRLPPVIPGQEVSAGGGRKVRMISTAGPVPVSSATPLPIPEIPSNVIVDTRKD